MTYYAYRGDFANRYTVAAFATEAARNEWLELASENELARPITRKEARRELADNRLSPHDQDMRDYIGCYVGSRDPWTDEDRRRNAADQIHVRDVEAETRQSGQFGYEPQYRELDVCDPPVRL